MTQKFLNESSASLHFREDLGILIIRWGEAIEEEKIKEGYLELLKMAISVKSYFWMLDVRGRGPGGENDYWVLNYFLPEVRSKINHPVRIAYLLAPSHFEYVIARLPKKELSETASATKIQFFMTEDQAINWLTEEQ